MTSATLRLVEPTRLERALQSVAQRLTRYVDARIVARAERREITLELLREQQTRRSDPQALEIALISLGSRPR